MNNDSAKVLQILEAGFPMPDFLDLLAKNGGVLDLSGASACLLASQAVHSGDLDTINQMVLTVAEKLISGESLLVPERAWLLYVLKKISPHGVPHEHQGRAPTPSINRLALMYRLGVAMIDQELSSPLATVTDRLRKSADRLEKSYELVRALYYSPAYKRLSERGNFERFRRENMGTDK